MGQKPAKFVEIECGAGRSQGHGEIAAALARAVVADDVVGRGFVAGHFAGRQKVGANDVELDLARVSRHRCWVFPPGAREKCQKRSVPVSFSSVQSLRRAIS